MKAKDRVYSLKGCAEAAAALAGVDKPVSTQQVRRFDAILQPARTETGQRIYTQQQVEIARVVLHPKK